MKNYYELLKITSHETNINGAYENILYEWIPDHFKDSDFIAQLVDFRTAFKLLQNPWLRILYDRELQSTTHKSPDLPFNTYIENQILRLCIIWFHFSEKIVIKKELQEDKWWETVLWWWV